jgi:hypothetical protein
MLLPCNLYVSKCLHLHLQHSLIAVKLQLAIHARDRLLHVCYWTESLDVILMGFLLPKPERAISPHQQLPAQGPDPGLWSKCWETYISHTFPNPMLLELSGEIPPVLVIFT